MGSFVVESDVLSHTLFICIPADEYSIRIFTLYSLIYIFPVSTVDIKHFHTSAVATWQKWLLRRPGSHRTGDSHRVLTVWTVETERKKKNCLERYLYLLWIGYRFCQLRVLLDARR